MKKLLLVLFLLGTFGVQAQTMTEEEQAAAIAQLTEEVNSLKAKAEKQDKWDKFLSKMPKVSGYVMGRYTYGDATEEDSDISTFRLRRVRLSVSGDITKKLEYKFQAELTSFKLLDAYFDYKPFEQFKIKAGQFKVPFTIENTDYTPTKMVLIDHAMLIDRMEIVPSGDSYKSLGTAGRELGINLHGSFFGKKLQYDLAVFNGAGLNTTDNNKSKDVVGRLRYTIVDGLTISGSYYWGEYGKEYYGRERWSVGGVYDKGHLLVRGEYLAAKTGLGDGSHLHSEGWYALGAWRFNDAWSVAARYDTFTADQHWYKGTTQTNYTIGMAWKPIKYFRLQFNYVYEDNAVLDEYYSSHGARNTFMVQATASF